MGLFISDGVKSMGKSFQNSKQIIKEWNHRNIRQNQISIKLLAKKSIWKLREKNYKKALWKKLLKASTRAFPKTF